MRRNGRCSIFLQQLLGVCLVYFFTDQEKVETYAEVKKCEVERFKKFFHGMLKKWRVFCAIGF